MAKTSKHTTDRSTSTVDLGKTRKERIERFRAAQLLNGVTMPKIDEAINFLVDRGLEAEGITL